jgi:hypothetical protein
VVEQAPVIELDGLSTLPITAYTIAFGVLLVAGLLLIILGFEILDSPVIAVVTTIIPLSLATGLVWQHLTSIRIPYVTFAVLGFAAVLLTRSIPLHNRLPTLTIAIVHGIAGLTIFLLPVILSLQGARNPPFALVGIGGALMGVGGLLLSFLKTGRPLVSREIILKMLPGLLLLMTVFFVAGFKYG